MYSDDSRNYDDVVTSDSLVVRVSIFVCASTCTIFPYGCIVRRRNKRNTFVGNTSRILRSAFLIIELRYYTCLPAHCRLSHTIFALGNFPDVRTSYLPTPPFDFELTSMRGFDPLPSLSVTMSHNLHTSRSTLKAAPTKGLKQTMRNIDEHFRLHRKLQPSFDDHLMVPIIVFNAIGDEILKRQLRSWRQEEQQYPARTR